MFPTVIQAEHGPHLFLHVIHRARSRRATRCPFFTGEVDFETVCILIANAGFGEGFARPSPKPRHIPCEHVVFRFPFDNPLRSQKPHTARL